MRTKCSTDFKWVDRKYKGYKDIYNQSLSVSLAYQLISLHPILHWSHILNGKQSLPDGHCVDTCSYIRVTYDNYNKTLQVNSCFLIFYHRIRLNYNFEFPIHLFQLFTIANISSTLVAADAALNASIISNFLLGQVAIFILNASILTNNNTFNSSTFNSSIAGTFSTT